MKYVVTSIEKFAFAYCKQFTDIKIPDSVTSIGNSTFLCCTGLKSVTFSQNLTQIEEKAFINCYNLTKIEFPASVTYIGKDAFKVCTDLKEIIFKGRKNLDGIDIYDTWLTDGRHGKIFFEP